MTGPACKVIAGCFALAAFTVAVVAGLAGGNTATSILTRALIAMVVCYPLGLLIGLVCQHVVNEHIRSQAGADEAARGAASRAEQSAENAEEAEDAIVV